MTEETPPPISSQELEAERLRAEAEKHRAEARRATLEALELERQIQRPWFQNRLFLQAIVAGLVAVPLIWFYVKEVAIPVF